MGSPALVVLDKFLGLRENQSGDLTLEEGELSVCNNCRITDNLKIRKRDGYDELVSASGTATAVQGMWHGKVGGAEKFVIAKDGTLYDTNTSTGNTSSIGTLTDARTYMFGFGDNLYIQNGNEYKVWTGTGNISNVTGYIPTVSIGTPPAGGGTPFEEVNTLTGSKIVSFSGDAASATYQLPETAITSVDSVVVDGATLTVTTDYTVNLTNGTVSPNPASKFTSGTDNVLITYTKGTGDRTFVTNHKQSVLYGGKNDTRVFMFGDGNKLIYSELADSLPSADYFPESNLIYVGSDNYDITGLQKQYDRLNIFKENETHFASYLQDSTLGTIFSVSPLNDTVGNNAFGETRLILNNPFTVTHKGIYQFTGSNVRDERNAIFKSQRVQLGLDTLAVENAVTFDFERNFEYFVCVGNVAYIYNYKVDCWYKYTLTDTPSCFIEIDGTAYFGTDNGEVMKFSSVAFDDDGTIFTAEWETGFLDFGANFIRKFLTYGYFGMTPEGKSVCNIDWETDQGTSQSSYEVKYNLIDFTNVDFSDFSFSTNYNPQPFRKKLKAKKFAYLKIKGKNESSTERMTILTVSLPAVTGGNVK
jgi:hypothetical protein